MSSTIKMPVYFISHGGGPWPWLTGSFRQAFQLLEASLKALPAELPQPPKAILVISGHWEEEDFAIMSSPSPGMVYDYSGFPAHTYHIQYPAPGSPALADRVQHLLKDAGITSHLDPEQGFDHGTFVPLAVAYPNADIPVIEVSIRKNYDPVVHLAAGKALAPLRDENILIIGSGLSYHNLRMFDARAAIPSREFDGWLQETLLNNTEINRNNRLMHWTKAPSARIAHPREDHLIPLLVAAGAAESDAATLCYHEDDLMGGIAVSSFRFG